MELAIVLSALTISGVTGLFVYQKNPRGGTHVYFSLLAFFIGAYPVFNYLAVHSSSNEQALLWAKIILLVSIPQGPLLYFFARTFPKPSFIFNRRRQTIIALWVCINFILAASGMIFAAVSVDNGKVSIRPGPLVPSFGLLHVSTIIAGLTVLGSKFKHSSGMAKRQLAYIFFGILVSFSLTFLITFVLPVLLNNTILLAISPLFLSLAVVAVAYAVVSQHLFDIRSAATRSVAYALVLVTIVGIYSLGLFGVTNTIFAGPEYELTRQILSVVFVVPIALGFQPTKRFFDRVSNKIFFQDAYDPQQFLNRLNTVLVGNIDLQPLLRQSAELIEETMKAEYCYFVVRQSEKESARIVGTQNLTIDSNKVVNDVKLIELQKKKRIVFDDLEEQHASLKNALYDSRVAVAQTLMMPGGSKLHYGYMVLGNKKSGNPFNGQDLRIIEIIANELVIAIQNALRFEEIGQFNVTLQQKVNDATRKLRQTNEKLRALDETKDEFISMASHQLRTPLTSVKGYVSMVVEGDAGRITKQQKDLLNQAFASSQRMVYLIADLLNVSRLRTGKFVIENKPTQLADVVEGEISQLLEAAKSKNLTMTYHKPKDFPVLSMDETKIRQVVMNFADNALYYTPTGGHVDIILEEKGAMIEFKVVDDGLGVPKADQHHLFSKFYRAGNARKARPDGTGLGLFMAKKVVVAQGGAIIFSSQEGKGSTFGFTFPKSLLKVTAKTAKAPTNKPGHLEIDTKA